MNRSLWIPAIGCVVGFASLYALLNRAVGEAQSADALVATSNALPSEPAPLAASEAEHVLASLCDAYRERWRAWETSPHRLFSRAAVKPVSPRSIEFALSPASTAGDDAFLLATIRVHERTQVQTIPCVVHPQTKQVRLFYEGSWVTGDDWLQTIPTTPNALRRRE
jgi:hypothetical protein